MVRAESVLEKRVRVSGHMSAMPHLLVAETGARISSVGNRPSARAPPRLLITRADKPQAVHRFRARQESKLHLATGELIGGLIHQPLRGMTAYARVDSLPRACPDGCREVAGWVR
jgi:hypothetical protein